MGNKRYEYPCQRYMRKNAQMTFKSILEEYRLDMYCPLVHKSEIISIDAELIIRDRIGITETAILDGMRKVCRECPYDI